MFDLVLLLMLTPLLLVLSTAMSQPSSGPTKSEIAARVSAKLTVCPPGGVPIKRASLARTGHHQVFLSWNAGVSSTGQSDVVDGYCVYRSTKQNVAKQKATCSDCERLSAVALPATACFDDIVADGATYYYVVTAVKAGQMSSSSNETAAHVPASAHPGSIAQLRPTFSCRNSASGKTPKP
jgi:hypothetical protein